MSNFEEFQNGTDPINADTDSDGMNDSAEINTWGTNPFSGVEYLFLNQNLTIENNQTLILSNSEMVVNSTANNTYGIYVKEGGSLYLESTEINSNDGNYTYEFIEEGNMYIVPESYLYLGVKGKGVLESSMRSMAPIIDLPESFWELSLPERRIVFFEKAMIGYIPQEIISENDLIAGGRFHTQLSKCFTEKEAKKFWKKNLETRKAVFKFHNSGFGNLGATGGHLIPDYETIIKKGFNYYLR